MKWDVIGLEVVASDSSLEGAATSLSGETSESHIIDVDSASPSTG